jgi:polysaccharide pyruvyl transferase WcaK-like protein
MTSLRQVRRRTRATAVAPNVGLFGILGGGNVGNDGSLEAVLAYLRAEHPDAILDFLCTGPEQVTARYGIPASRLGWYRSELLWSSGMMVRVLKSLGIALGIGIDAFRTASWVRRHDVVIVPGMGVLEATVPMRPWQTPYLMFLLCASGRLFGTKVALVSVGANDIHRRLTRWLITAAARLAYYRSFRDPYSRDAMRRMGVDTSGDNVYPDLAFSLPTPREEPGAAGTVGVGVMDYLGGNEDRRQANEIHASYVEKMTRFVVWLVDNGRPIRLLTGDEDDERVVQEILVDLRARRPQLGRSQVIAEPVSSLDQLMQQMASVDTVVATRFHNVVCAVKLAKPTLALSYAAKHEVLMADMGLSGFCQSVKSLDVARLIEQFTELESRSEQLRLTMTERNAAKARLVDDQFAELSAVLFPAADTTRTAAGHKPARTSAC